MGVEPDPLAQRLFERRFPQVAVRWLEADFLGPRNGAMTVAGLTELRAQLPDHAVLFCNVLGQLPILHSEARDEGFLDFLDAIPQALMGASWASYHDRISGPWPPAVAQWRSDAAVSTADLIAKMYVQPTGGAQFDYGDHLTGSIAPDQPRQFWTWWRTPDDFHVIEAICSVRVV